MNAQAKAPTLGSLAIAALEAHDNDRHAADAARAAPMTAASDAARAAARDAARYAAWDAAWAAARHAPWDAARAAASAAEENWQFDRLIAWLSDNEPDDWPLPEIAGQEAA